MKLQSTMKHVMWWQFLKAVGVSATLAVFGRDNVQRLEPHVAEIWDDSNKLPVGVEILVASVWICMFAGIPFFIRAFDGRQATKTQLILTVVFLVSVGGGLFLFTNVVKFNSYHFKGQRTLTIVECIYLMSQVVTTVGYGDITPAYPRGQVFVGLYVLCSLFVIAMMLTELVAHVSAAADRYRQNLIKRRVQTSPQEPQTQKRKALAAAKFAEQEVEPPSTASVLVSFACFAFFAVTWILFFHFYPGENKTWLQAIYMSVITLSTVGFGAFTPSTPAGQVFAAFWMILGSAALVSVITKFTELMLKVDDYERYDPGIAKQQLQAFQQERTKSSMTDEISELEMLKFALVSRGIVSEADISLFEASFKDLSSGEKDGKAVVSLNDFLACVNKLS